MFICFFPTETFALVRKFDGSDKMDCGYRNRLVKVG